MALASELDRLEAEHLRQQAFKSVMLALRMGDMTLCQAVNRMRLACWKAWRDYELPHVELRKEQDAARRKESAACGD